MKIDFIITFIYRLYENISESDSISNVIMAALEKFLWSDNVYAYKYNFSEKVMLDVLKKVAPNCDDFLFDCIWNGVKGNCSEIFRVMPTVWILLLFPVILTK